MEASALTTTTSKDDSKVVTVEDVDDFLLVRTSNISNIMASK